MDNQYWKHKEGWLYIGNKTEGASPATKGEISAHQRSKSQPEKASDPIGLRDELIASADQ
ncbi:hypothetical protein [Pectobacterium carotovorum]|uniref:Uncharacterized protein n=1 Tax=Pectobacterium carotovorum subsp. carotovorum TaxID=555 RepID=A0AAI9PFA6_PECCC|nr:hypothetical protein [Pectobacterium carotovorum]GKX48554.1 hypothetical protein SOASR016_33060 [Pectobacterium carotovorum subsp. carotovorum]GLV70997.1 hypothetical protein Pcaca03_34410 [Pectobacterium carotovorum subsp. carotovorum]